MILLIKLIIAIRIINSIIMINSIIIIDLRMNYYVIINALL